MTDQQHLPSIITRPIRWIVHANEPFTIRHELGRVPAGWLVIDTNTAVNVYRSGEMNTSLIELTADQDAEITLVLL